MPLPKSMQTHCPLNRNHRANRTKFKCLHSGRLVQKQIQNNVSNFIQRTMSYASNSGKQVIRWQHSPNTTVHSYPQLNLNSIKSISFCVDISNQDHSSEFACNQQDQSCKQKSFLFCFYITNVVELISSSKNHEDSTCFIKTQNPWVPLIRQI